MVGLLFIQHQLFGDYEIFVSDEYGAQFVFMVSKINLSPFLLEGADALEQFERSREIQDFDFLFSSERTLQDSELLDGHDPVLTKQLRLKLSAL